MRKGMMLGRGKGYKNVIGSDPRVHGQSARGMKQPQKIPLYVDFSSAKSMKKSEAIKYNLEKKGYRPEKTIQLGFDKWKTEYVKGGKNEDGKNYLVFSKGKGVIVESNVFAANAEEAKSKIVDSESARFAGVKSISDLEAVPATEHNIRVHEHMKDDVGADTYYSIKEAITGSPRYEGGKLPFSKDGIGHADLPIENAVYVPSTDKNQKQIPEKEFRKRIAQTENFLSKLFGGFTRFDDFGGYKMGNDVIKEKGARVVSFATSKDAKDKQKIADLKQWLVIKQKQWGQDTIGFENEGDLHYIKGETD